MTFSSSARRVENSQRIQYLYIHIRLVSCSQEASGVLDVKSWPITLDMDDMPKRKLSSMYRAPTAEMLAYLDFR